MGGKSRKKGKVSEELIKIVKAVRAPIRDKEKGDRECEKSLEKMEDEILERIKQDCKDWNSKLYNASCGDS